MKADLDMAMDLLRLLDADSFRDVCKSFSELFGIGIKVFDAEGRKIVDIRASTGDHCGYLFSVHPTRVACTNLVSHVRSVALPSGASRVAPTQVDCFSGLRYKIIPVLHEGSVLGRVIFGPYAPASLKGPPRTLGEYEKDGLNLATLNGFLEVIPRAGEDAVERVLNNIANVIEVIVHAGYKAYVTSQMHIAAITGAFDDAQKANLQLKVANERLQELDRLKSNFIATVSHELRTPLTSVIGYSEMLMEGMAGALNPEQKDYVQTILEKGESLLSLIGQVLDLSRIESGNVAMRYGKVDPREIMKASMSDVTPQAQKRQLILSLDVAENVQPILLDADKVRRIVTNLLSNAVKFTQPGGNVTLKVAVAEAPPAGETKFDAFEPQRNRYLEIKVSDTGIGIPADKLDQIFESFFQVDSSSTREFGGTGLGLAIVRNFARAHGGQVSVESEMQKGSTFTVILPYDSEPRSQPAGIDGVGMPESTNKLAAH